MEHPGSEPRPRPDQQAALEELERFGRDIQRYRAQREALGEEFDAFVRSFKEPPPGVRAERATPARTETPSIFEPPVLATPVPDTPVLETPVPDTPVIENPVPKAPVLETPTPAPEVAAPAMAQPAEAAELPVPPARAQTPIAAVAAGAALLVGGGLLAVLLWNRGPAPSSDPAANPDAPPAAAPAPSTAATTAPDSSAAPAAAPAAAPTPTPAAPSSGSEIVAERRVWMRVTVDGARVLEREVPAGTRIPLKAEKTIVIRTGDAGAVRLSIRGGPGALLGREGEVVTRAFTVPPRGEAPR